MYVFKCKCGCFFSLKEMKSDSLRCNNCDNQIWISSRTEFRSILKDLEAAEMTMQMVPDDSKIRIAFEFTGN